MKTQLAIVFAVFVLSVVHANPHVVRRQVPSSTGAETPASPAPSTGPQAPTSGETPAPVSGATAGGAPTADAPAAPPAAPETETQGRAAIGQRFRPQPPPPPPPAPVAPQPETNQAGPSVFTLPDGADLIVGQINGGFTCDDKIYGYYADTNNDCKIFHVCVPIPSEDGVATQPPLLFSFFCNNGTLFNQEALVCDYSDNVDCSLATTYYSVNEEFGKIPDENAEGRGPAPAGSIAPAPGPVAPRANIPPPPPSAARPPTPVATPTVGAAPTSGAATPGGSVSVTAPEASVSASVPEASVSASVPEASVSASVPGASATAGESVGPTAQGSAATPSLA